MPRNFKRPSHVRRGIAIAAVFVIGASLSPMALRASDQYDAKQTNTGANRQLVFSSPNAALEALLLAFKGKDEKALLDIFGHDHEKLLVVTDKIARGEALDRLYETTERWEELAGILAQEAELAPSGDSLLGWSWPSSVEENGRSLSMVIVPPFFELAARQIEPLCVAERLLQLLERAPKELLHRVR